MSDSRASLAARIKEHPRVFDAAAAARLVESLGVGLEQQPEAVQRLLRGVGGCSPFLSRLAVRAPDALFEMLGEAPEKTLEAIIARADAAGDGESLEETMRALRLVRADAALLIGLSEIAGAWTSLEAAAGLSDFADAAVNAALRVALRKQAGKGFVPGAERRLEACSGIAVLAMGKLGARELNYSSDIDLVVIYEPQAPALGDPYAAREIAVAAARLMVRILNEQTADGYVFRTDLRLRPDPGVSAAAVSAPAAESYYEAHGQNWERAAFVKARAAAGDIAVGEAFLRALRPFVWRKYLDFAAIEDIHSIKRQIHAAKGGDQIEFYGHDIKTGRGGIREIEFLAQTQQLILGGKDPALRHRPTVDALAALADAGQVSADALTELTENYQYLRRVEHRLQMIADEQTHKLPRERDAVERLAAFLGEADARALEENLCAVLRSTHDRFSVLFEREERLSGSDGSLSFTGVENDAATLETLARLGFNRPGDVSDTIRRWHAGTIRATRTRRARELLTKLAPRLLESLSKASDPDAAFLAFDDFLKRLPAGVQVFSLFAHNPQIFDTLIRIMTIAPFLGRQLSRRRHLIEALLESGWPRARPNQAELSADLAERLERAASYEEKLNEARRWGAGHRFDVAAQLVIGAIDAAAAAAAFTAIADIAIAAMTPVAIAETVRLHGKIDGALVVAAMGRLGAGVMTATSDVDIVFVYEAALDAVSDGPRPLDSATYFTRLVRRIVTTLSAATEEGALYEVDMQLRPSGSKGPWAVSLSAFERYYEDDAWTWEAMALTKARIVTGEARLAEKVRTVVDTVICKKRDRAALAADVLDMRARLAEAKPPTSPWNIKTADGGLADLDFLLAFLALEAASEIGAPPRNQRALIQFLAEKKRIDAADAARLLTASELFETVMQLARAATGEVFSPQKAGAALTDRMAAACGAASVEAAGERLVALEAQVKSMFSAAVVGEGKRL